MSKLNTFVFRPIHPAPLTISPPSQSIRPKPRYGCYLCQVWFDDRQHLMSHTRDTEHKNRLKDEGIDPPIDQAENPASGSARECGRAGGSQ